MKNILFTMAVLLPTALGAQTPSSPSSAPFSTPGTPALAPSPVSPRPSPIVPGTPGFSSQVAPGSTNAVGGGFTNQFGTNFFGGNSVALSSALVALQNNLLQTLPLLASATSNSSPFALSLLQQLTNAAPMTTPPANLSQNLASSAAANLAQNLATPTGGSTAPATPPSPFAVSTNAPVPPGALAPPGPGFTNLVGTPVGGAETNGLTGFFATPNGNRLLMILQNDIERLLPELALLNAGGITLATNGLIPQTLPAITPQTTNQVLTPTGR